MRRFGGIQRRALFFCEEGISVMVEGPRRPMELWIETLKHSRFRVHRRRRARISERSPMLSSIVKRFYNIRLSVEKHPICMNLPPNKDPYPPSLLTPTPLAPPPAHNPSTRVRLLRHYSQDKARYLEIVPQPHRPHAHDLGRQPRDGIRRRHDIAEHLRR